VSAAIVLGVIVLCAMVHRGVPQVDVPASAAELVVADGEPVVPPAPIPEPLPVAASPLPLPEPPPAATEPGTAKPAASAPPSGLLPGPAAVGLAKGYGEPRPFRFRRRDHSSADELGRQLLAVLEVDLDHEVGTSGSVVDSAMQRGKSALRHPVLRPLLGRDDLHGLPLAMGADCQLGKESAQCLQVLSRKLRRHLSELVPADQRDSRINADALRCRLQAWWDEGVRRALVGQGIGGVPDQGEDADKNPGEWAREEALPTLVQMLQAEDRPVRLVLVEVLGHIKGRAASAALAQRALFDLAADVREAAVRALRDRPRDEYRGVLLDGLRYPWPPAADHAAEALVALEDRDAVPELAALVLASDPVSPARRVYRPVDPADIRTAPRAKDPLADSVVALVERHGPLQLTTHLSEPSDVPHSVRAGPSAVYTVREMVRINHLRNCLLCHALATSPTDPVRGLVPSPGQPLPPPFSTPYYEGQNGIFVRADITYIRQDFSVPQPVTRAGNWPAHQRYDYVVRTRYPSKEELRREEPATYPQREAVRWALRELSAAREVQAPRQGAAADSE